MDDDLDFEEDLDFGNVDSLLYETTDDNIKDDENSSDNENEEIDNKSDEEVEENGDNESEEIDDISEGEVEENDDNESEKPDNRVDEVVEKTTESISNDSEEDQNEVEGVKEDSNEVPDDSRAEVQQINENNENEEFFDAIDSQMFSEEDSDQSEEVSEPLPTVPQNKDPVKALDELENLLQEFEGPNVSSKDSLRPKLNTSIENISTNKSHKTVSKNNLIEVKSSEKKTSTTTPVISSTITTALTKKASVTTALTKATPETTASTEKTSLTTSANKSSLATGLKKKTPENTSSSKSSSNNTNSIKKTSVTSASTKASPGTTVATKKTSLNTNSTKTSATTVSTKNSSITTTSTTNLNSTENSVISTPSAKNSSVDMSPIKSKSNTSMTVLQTSPSKSKNDSVKSVAKISSINNTSNVSEISSIIKSSLNNSVSAKSSSLTTPSVNNSSILNVSVNKTSVQNINSLVNNSTTTPTTPFFERKTLDLDLKFYNSLRIYLTEGKVIGYAEEPFIQDSKKFTLKKGKLFLHNTREVIETDTQQREIAIRYHLNPGAKTEKSRHRGVSATVKAIERLYFWGTIKFDVDNVINQCRVCNPKEYDLTSYQLWKYIEIGVIERVLIVRDLSEKSSIFNCSFLVDFNAFNLSKHLIVLFKTYGTPNAIRIVLEKESQKEFTEELSDYLRKGLLQFIEEVEFVSQNSTDKEIIKLPMVEIKIEFDAKKCPQNEKQLQTTYTITADDDISMFYIFSCNQWLISNSIFNTISTDIKNFAKKFNDWKTRVSSLTLYFQINGINLKANEEEEEEINSQESNSQRSKKSSQSRELERLLTDFKPLYPSIYKRLNKSEQNNKKSDNKKHNKKSSDLSDSSDDWSDDNISVASSRHSNSTKKDKKNKDSNENKSHKKSSKEQPFKEMLREQKRLSIDSIEIIDLEDSSQHSFPSQTGSVISVSSEPSFPPKVESNNSLTQKEIISKDLEKYDRKGLCQPCVVYLNPFSQQDIEKAIEGKYGIQEVVTNITEMDDNSNDKSQDSAETVRLNFQEPTEDPFKAIINKELEMRSNRNKTIEKNPSVDLNLSESSSEDEEKTKPIIKSKGETPSKPKTPKPQLNRSPTPSISQPLTTPSLRSQPKRKRNCNFGSDSDYDVKKDEAIVGANKKKVKFESKSKTSVTPKSKEKKRNKQISKRIVASASSGSESGEDNREIVRKNSSQKKPKPETETKEVLECAFCEFQTNQKMHYIMHTTKHKNEPKNAILCPDCSKTFYNKESLEKHKEEEHPPVIHNAILYGCEQCKQFSSYSIEELDQHLLSTHIEDMTFLKSYNSSKHRCELCKQFTATNKELMSKHMTQKHRMFRCAFDCPFVAPEFQTLQRHAKSLHPRYGTPFECKYCETNFSVFGALVQHREKSHCIDWTTDNLNKCGLCEETFAYDDTNQILEHMSTHSVDFPYFECKSCNKRCRQLELLKKHCETHHAIGPAEGLEAHIGNLSQLFEELRQQITNESNKVKKIQSNPNEMQNALLGLMDDQFVEDEQPTDFETTDLLATALDFALNEQLEDIETPTISIPEPEGNGEEECFIEEDAEGNWKPVSA